MKVPYELFSATKSPHFKDYLKETVSYVLLNTRNFQILKTEGYSLITGASKRTVFQTSAFLSHLKIPS